MIENSELLIQCQPEPVEGLQFGLISHFDKINVRLRVNFSEVSGNNIEKYSFHKKVSKS